MNTQQLFGQLALAQGFVDKQDVQACLAAQNEAKDKGSSVQRIGEIMVSRGMMTPEQVDTILGIQQAAPAAAPTSVAEEHVPQPEANMAENSSIFDYMGETEKFTFGDFEIFERIGVDATGFLYKANHKPSGKTVALRVFNKEVMASDPEFINHFIDRVQHATDLEHRNIQPIFTVGRAEERIFYATEFIEGVSLRRVIEAQEKLDLKVGIKMAAQIAKGLEYGHMKQVVHGAVNPSNILLCEDGSAKLTGFGIARKGSDTLNLFTMYDGMTACYLAPEQTAAADGFAADARSDIYSLGAVLYHALTGVAPFQGETTEEAYKEIAEGIVLPTELREAGVPEPVCQLILKMIAPDPAERYQTAREVLIALKPILRGPSPAVSVAPAAVPAAKPVATAAADGDETFISFEPGRVQSISTRVRKRESERKKVIRTHPPTPKKKHRPARTTPRAGYKGTRNKSADAEAAKKSKPKDPLVLAVMILSLLAVLALLVILIGIATREPVVKPTDRKMADQSIQPTTPAKTAAPVELTPATTPEKVPADAATKPEPVAANGNAKAEAKPKASKKDEEQPKRPRRFGMGLLQPDPVEEPKANPVPKDVPAEPQPAPVSTPAVEPAPEDEPAPVTEAEEPAAEATEEAPAEPAPATEETEEAPTEPAPEAKAEEEQPAEAGAEETAGDEEGTVSELEVPVEEKSSE